MLLLAAPFWGGLRSAGWHFTSSKIPFYSKFSAFIYHFKGLQPSHYFRSLYSLLLFFLRSSKTYKARLAPAFTIITSGTSSAFFVSPLCPLGIILIFQPEPYLCFFCCCCSFVSRPFCNRNGKRKSNPFCPLMLLTLTPCRAYMENMFHFP